MTRGKLAIIAEDGKLYASNEFNGDMYYEGYGEEIYDRLDIIDHQEEFEDFLAEFNEEYFNYNNVEVTELDSSYLNMQDDYFDKWFSDYIYIKNLSEKYVAITDSTGQKLSLNPDITFVLYIGKFVAASSEDFERAHFIDKLTTAKDELTHNGSANYSIIYNMCSDYDNNHQGSYLTDRIMEHNFVDEEILEYIVKENATDVSSLRCFINNTYDDDIYILDGYGNLANVDKADFEELIDNLIYDLKENIHIPKQRPAIKCQAEIAKKYKKI